MPSRCSTRPIALLALLAASLVAGACGGPRSLSEPGPAASELVLLRLDGSSFQPLAAADQSAVCLFLVRIDCPISNRYAPEVRRLVEEHGAGVDAWLVYSDADESPAAILEHVAAHDYPLPALRDPEQRLAQAIGARVTPEVAVFGPDRTLVYAGRIDDRNVDFGVARQAPIERDLAEVLGALARGEQPAFRRVEAVGCPLPEPLP